MNKKIKLPNVAILSSCIVRTKSLAGDLCKQYFKVAIGEDTPEEPALLIRKLVLSNHTELYTLFKALKTFKDKTLYEQGFSVRLSTLDKAQKLLVKNQILKSEP